MCEVCVRVWCVCVCDVFGVRCVCVCDVCECVMCESVRCVCVCDVFACLMCVRV